MPHAQWLRDRRGQNHPRISAAGEACDPCRRPGLAWRREREDELLASCYRRALELAQANALSSLAYPAISTGVYRFPADRAAGIAVATVADALGAAPGVTKVIFCCFSRDSARLHEAALAAFGSPCAD